MPVAMTKGGQRYYLAYDQVGSLRAVTDASGNLVKRIEYDTFGNVTSDSNTAFAVPFGFAGGLYDADTGLVRFGYRDYDPDAGRWTAKDPIGFAGGDTDLYGYCLSDPVNWIDPDGLTAVMEWAVPIAIVISQLDTSLPGPADAIAGAIIGAAWLYDNWPDILLLNENSEGIDDPCQKKKKIKAKDRRKAEKEKDREQKHGDADWEEPASEDYAKWKARQLEKRSGKGARREAHDAPHLRDRSKKRLNGDYE
nr:RHS repeat-associated core domain-containing protein [Desulfonema ishimotonii]